MKYTFTKLNHRYAYVGQFKLENLLPGLNGQSIGSSLTSIDFSGVTTFLLPAGTTLGGASLTALGAITSSSANAFSVGLNGTTNPAFNVDASTGSQAAGLNIIGATAAGTVAVAVISSGGAANLTLDALGTGTLKLGTISTGNITLGAAGSSQAIALVSAGASALAVGRLGATTPALKVDASTATSITGVQIKAAGTGGGVAILAIGETNVATTIDAAGTGTLKLNSVATNSGIVTIGNTTALAGAVVNGPVQINNNKAAINSSATATAAQVATGYITSTSAAGTTITLPTGTLLGAQLGAVQGTIFDLTIDNTAGASTVTVAVAVNGILSAAAAANAASQGLLTVPSGVTGQGVFRLMFSSSTAYTFTRIA